jgi:membrane-bound inhibitor of C-type lysozyme
MIGRLAILTTTLALGTLPAEAGPPPTADCAKLRKGSIEALICNSPLLASLDAEVARLYALALGPPGNAGRNDALKEHAAWIAERNACLQTPQADACLRDRYFERINTLRVGWRAARTQDDKGITRGPVTYRCEDIEGYVSITFVQAEEPIAWLQRKDAQEMLVARPVASGARYEGLTPEHFFWIRGDDAVYRDTNGLKDATCTVEPIG